MAQGYLDKARKQLPILEGMAQAAIKFRNDTGEAAEILSFLNKFGRVNSEKVCDWAKRRGINDFQAENLKENIEKSREKEKESGFQRINDDIARMLQDDN